MGLGSFASNPSYSITKVRCGIVNDLVITQLLINVFFCISVGQTRSVGGMNAWSERSVSSSFKFLQKGTKYTTLRKGFSTNNISCFITSLFFFFDSLTF